MLRKQTRWAGLVLGGAFLCGGTAPAVAQASALPSAQGAPVNDDAAHGRGLLDAMISALGGETWLKINTERIDGRGATFYKGLPNPYEAQFEEYLRLKPFGERLVLVSKQGVFIPTTKRDVAEVWTPEAGYEVSYHGRKELPKVEVDEFERRRRHSFDTVVRDWLQRPGTIVTYEGSDMDDRHLVDHVSVITRENEAVTLGLDQDSHLPRSLTFQWHDPIYKDINTDVERYDDWHSDGGVMTAFTITRFHNGDMVSQRFLTRVQYDVPMAADLFDPDRPLTKK